MAPFTMQSANLQAQALACEVAQTDQNSTSAYKPAAQVHPKVANVTPIASPAFEIVEPTGAGPHKTE
jgi:hypothetical protein